MVYLKSQGILPGIKVDTGLQASVVQHIGIDQCVELCWIVLVAGGGWAWRWTPACRQALHSMLHRQDV